MDHITGRPDSITDYLITLHIGPWFNYRAGGDDDLDELYVNLRVEDGYEKPSENECSTALAKMQAEYESQKYGVDRRIEYGKLNQFEMQFDDQRDGTTTWVDAINTIKGKYPKE